MHSPAKIVLRVVATIAVIDATIVVVVIDATRDTSHEHTKQAMSAMPCVVYTNPKLLYLAPLSIANHSHTHSSTHSSQSFSSTRPLFSFGSLFSFHFFSSHLYQYAFRASLL
jgi:hypothetical protein